MKAAELRDLTPEELRQRLLDTREEVFNLRIQKSVGDIERPLRIRTLRRDISKMLTVMKERETA